MDKPVTFATTLGTGAAVRGANVVAWATTEVGGLRISFRTLQERSVRGTPSVCDE